MSRPKQKPNLLPITQEQKPIATENRDSREDRFISLLFQGLPVREAGISAGYAEEYSRTGLYVKFKDEKFQTKLRDYALANNAQSIPKVCDLYAKTVDVLHKQVSNGDLSNMSKLGRIPETILKIGKILTPEMVGGVPLVHIDNLQMLIQGKVINGKKTTDGSAE